MLRALAEGDGKTTEKSKENAELTPKKTVETKPEKNQKGKGGTEDVFV